MLNQTDAHYTPAWLADRLVAELDPVFAATRIPTIADFAAGDGSLLEAVERRFGEGKMIATDVDRRAVAQLRRTHPRWRTGTCDLLSPTSRRASPLVDGATRRPHAVVLNPPFSYRGNRSFPAFGGSLRCSPALAVLSAAIEQVRAAGTLIALIPTSTLTAQKDEETWRVIRELAQVIVLDEFTRGAFRGAYANVGLVALTAIDTAAVAEAVAASRCAKSGDSRPDVQASTPHVAAEVRVHRGCLPMYLADMTEDRSGGIALIHSTDLQAGKVLVRRWIRSGSRVLHGPAVLVPRVGQPRRDKVALLGAGDRVVLSDCLVGLEGRTGRINLQLLKSLREQWEELAHAYHGSCAPYLTMRDIHQIVEKLGFSVE